MSDQPTPGVYPTTPAPHPVDAPLPPPGPVELEVPEGRWERPAPVERPAETSEQIAAGLVSDLYEETHDVLDEAGAPKGEPAPDRVRWLLSRYREAVERAEKAAELAEAAPGRRWSSALVAPAHAALTTAGVPDASLPDRIAALVAQRDEARRDAEETDDRLTGAELALIRALRERDEARAHADEAQGAYEEVDRELRAARAELALLAGEGEPAGGDGVADRRALATAPAVPDPLRATAAPEETPGDAAAVIRRDRDEEWAGRDGDEAEAGAPGEARLLGWADLVEEAAEEYEEHAKEEDGSPVQVDKESAVRPLRGTLLSAGVSLDGASSSPAEAEGTSEGERGERVLAGGRWLCPIEESDFGPKVRTGLDGLTLLLHRDGAGWRARPWPMLSHQTYRRKCVEIAAEPDRHMRLMEIAALDVWTGRARTIWLHEREKEPLADKHGAALRSATAAVGPNREPDCILCGHPHPCPRHPTTFQPKDRSPGQGSEPSEGDTPEERVVWAWLIEHHRGGLYARDVRDLLRRLSALREPEGERLTGGVALIAAERRRQVEAEGYDAAHDDADAHANGQLAFTAAELAIEWCDLPLALEEGHPGSYEFDHCGSMAKYARWGTKPDRIRALSIAGALIAAEIDRVLRRAPSAPGSSSTPASATEPRKHVLDCDEYHRHEPPKCCALNCWCRTGASETTIDSPPAAVATASTTASRADAAVATPPEEPPVLHEEREHDVVCCCGDHLRPTGTAKPWTGEPDSATPAPPQPALRSAPAESERSWMEQHAGEFAATADRLRGELDAAEQHIRILQQEAASRAPLSQPESREPVAYLRVYPEGEGVIAEYLPSAEDLPPGRYDLFTAPVSREEPAPPEPESGEAPVERCGHNPGNERSGVRCDLPQGHEGGHAAWMGHSVDTLRIEWCAEPAPPKAAEAPKGEPYGFGLRWRTNGLAVSGGGPHVLVAYRTREGAEQMMGYATGSLAKDHAEIVELFAGSPPPAEPVGEPDIGALRDVVREYRRDGRVHTAEALARILARLESPPVPPASNRFWAPTIAEIDRAHHRLDLHGLPRVHADTEEPYTLAARIEMLPHHPAVPPAGGWTEEAKAVREAASKAQDMIHALNGTRLWELSIPARDDDPDLVFQNLVSRTYRLLARLETGAVPAAQEGESHG